MGRSSASCFKIIACGGTSESVDRDDLDASSQNKDSDKRGWSFRKRSARDRLLSNTVVTEIPSSENKESLEPAIVNSEEPLNSSICEKTSGNQWTEEMPQLSTSTTKGVTMSTLMAKDDVEDDIKLDSNPDESVIIIIQASVRRFLAQRELLRHKKVVMLQAAVRGYLVRTYAVGTLRCIQAIVKMQALVRARANLSAKRSSVGEKGAQDCGTKPHPTYISIEKLLSNRFARQLLDSTPRTKNVSIKCDPTRSDLAWKWMERWMSVSSPETVESHALKLEKDKVDNIENQVETVTVSNRELTDIKSEVGEAAIPSGVKEKLSISEENSILSHDHDESQSANTYVPDLKEKSDFLPDENRCLDTGAQKETNLISEKPVPTTEQPKRPAKRVATESADSEGRKSVFGSRKASNPAFIAAQSRFEELTSKSSSLKSVGSSKDNVVDYPADTSSSAPENAIRTRGFEPVVQIGGSECGTELSITSTLDSPDQSEFGNMEFEKEAKVLEKEAGVTKSNNNINDEHALLGTELTFSVSFLPEKDDGVDGAESKQLKPDTNSSNVHLELEPEIGCQTCNFNVHVGVEPETGHQLNKSSPEVSPKSHVTVSESQGTPSSQLLNNKTRIHKKISSQKRKSWSDGKKSSPVRSNLNAGLGSSLEHLPKDPKHGRRRNSFGSQGSDHIDQEPRDSSSSSNTLPSYMQATESARAKALANSSPRSSPDMQGKEIHMKKRHSLPGALNGRQGSPRMQRPISQAQQTTKANASQERKWQR